MHPGLADTTERVAVAGRGADARRPCGRGSRPRARAGARAYAPPAPQHSPSSSVSTSAYAGAEHGAHRAVRPAARGAGGTGPARRPRAGSAAARSGGCVDEPFREVAHAGRERARPRRCRAAGRSPSSPRRNPRCRRRPARHPASTRSPARQRAAPRSIRPACTCSAPQQSPPRPGSTGARAGGAHHAQRGAVDVALPRVHHAPGEAGTRRRAAASARQRRAQRRGRRARAARTAAGRAGGAARAERAT